MMEESRPFRLGSILCQSAGNADGLAFDGTDDSALGYDIQFGIPSR
jgi:hypothetical protein